MLKRRMMISKLEGKKDSWGKKGGDDSLSSMGNSKNFGLF